MRKASTKNQDVYSFLQNSPEHLRCGGGVPEVYERDECTILTYALVFVFRMSCSIPRFSEFGVCYLILALVRSVLRSLLERKKSLFAKFCLK